MNTVLPENEDARRRSSRRVFFYLRDAANDERAAGHSVVSPLGIRFYAAASLRTHDGLKLGPYDTSSAVHPRSYP